MKLKYEQFKIDLLNILENSCFHKTEYGFELINQDKEWVVGFDFTHNRFVRSYDKIDVYFYNKYKLSNIQNYLLKFIKEIFKITKLTPSLSVFMTENGLIDENSTTIIKRPI